MRAALKTVLSVAGVVLAAQAAAQVTLYEGEGFNGRAFVADRAIQNFDSTQFNDRAQSAVVERGRWEACEDAYFAGRCVVLNPGNYDSLKSIGLYKRISSIRPAGEVAATAYEYRQRTDERLYEVPVTSVHAVVGPPEQRCWVERQQVVEDRGGPNIPGAIVGGVIGGVLGHQIGSGRGQDVATAGGAVAGAAIGANVNRGGAQTYDRDVQRCETVPSSSRPDYWDVTYEFRGVQHRVQMTAPPGPTLTVNGNGEPRG